MATGPLPPWPLLAAAGLAGDASGALPLPTLGGIGPFEAGVVLGLTALGVDARAALAIGVTLHGGVLATIVVTGVVALAVGLARERRPHAHGVVTGAAPSSAPDEARLAASDAVAAWCLRNAERQLRLRNAEQAGLMAYVGAATAAELGQSTLCSGPLEALLTAIGRTIEPVAPADAAPRNRWLHVFTMTTPIGGHTALARRWIARNPGRRVHDVVLTGQAVDAAAPALAAAARASGRHRAIRVRRPEPPRPRACAAFARRRRRRGRAPRAHVGRAAVARVRAPRRPAGSAR